MRLSRFIHWLCGTEIQAVGLPYATALASAKARNYAALSSVPPFDADGLRWFEVPDSVLNAAEVDWVYANGGKVYRSIAVQQTENGTITTVYEAQEVYLMYLEMPWAGRNTDVHGGVSNRTDDAGDVRTWAEWAQAGGTDFHRSLDGTKVLLPLSFNSHPIIVPEVLIVRDAGGTILSKVEAQAALEPGGDYMEAE